MLVSKDHSYGVRKMVQYIEKVPEYKRLAIKGDQEPAVETVSQSKGTKGRNEKNLT